MSIYKNKGTADSAKRLATTGESAIYSIFNIKNNFVINTVRGIIFLIIGSIALPLRTTVRLRIGERSIDGVKFFIGCMIVLYIGLFGFTFNPVFEKEGKGWEKRAEYLNSVKPVREQYEDEESFREAYNVWYKVADNHHTGKGKWVVRLEKYFPNGNLSTLLYLFVILAMYNLHTFLLDKNNFIKRHSYYRGKTIWHLFNKNGEDELFWIADAFIWLAIGVLFISRISSVLGLLVVIQGLSLLIEEIAVKRKKRYAVLDMIDAEIESKIINEYRAKFVTKEESVRRNRTDKVEDVELA